MRTVRQIIEDAGGPHKIAAASRKTRRPIGFKTVYAWYANGIPEKHWDLMAKLANATPDELYHANRPLRRPSAARARVAVAA